MQAGVFKITPTDSASDENIKDNILKNQQLIKNWLGPCGVHQQTAWMLSAGPSLKFAMEHMFPKEWWARLDPDSYKIFCIKHALPVLQKAGIKPHFCVALDPRPIKGTSTHGEVREGLYATAPKETIFLIATMTSPSVTEYLMERGHRVVGWHAASHQVNDLIRQGLVNQGVALDGGTSSAMRALSIVQHLGFRKANLVGFDCSYLESEVDYTKTTELEMPDGTKKTKPKYLYARNPADKRDKFGHHTSGELVAQAQDLERALRNGELSDLELRMFATDPQRSYGGNVYEHTPNNTILPRLDERFILPSCTD